MSITPLYEFEEEWRQRMVKMHLEMPRGGELTGPIEGAYGEVYSITLPENTYPRRIAAKCPCFMRFATLEKATILQWALNQVHNARTACWPLSFTSH
jgi:hypothetical protein